MHPIDDYFEEFDPHEIFQLYHNATEYAEYTDHNLSRIGKPDLEDLYTVPIDPLSFEIADRESVNRIRLRVEVIFNSTLVQFNEQPLYDIRVLRNGITLIDGDLSPSGNSVDSHLYDTTRIVLSDGTVFRFSKCTPSLFKVALIELENLVASLTPPEPKKKKSRWLLLGRKKKNKEIKEIKQRVWNTRRKKE